MHLPMAEAKKLITADQLVGKEWNQTKELELFAATPPVDALKMFVIEAATVRAYDDSDKMLIVNDVS